MEEARSCKIMRKEYEPGRVGQALAVDVEAVNSELELDEDAAGGVQLADVRGRLSHCRRIQNMDMYLRMFGVDLLQGDPAWRMGFECSRLLLIQPVDLSRSDDDDELGRAAGTAREI